MKHATFIKTYLYLWFVMTHPKPNNDLLCAIHNPCLNQQP
jgi:hypothetical protein